MTKEKFMQSQKFGILLVICCGIMWGISGVLGQYVFQVSDVNSTQITVLRQFISGVVLLLISFMKNGKRSFAIFKGGKKFIGFFLFALTGIMGVQYTYFLAIENSNAATGTVIQFTYIIMILIYTALVLKKTPKIYETVAILCAFVGIFLIATHGSINSLAVSKEALFWGLVSAVCFSIYCLYPQELYREFDLINVIGWGSLIASIVLACITKTFYLPSMSPIVFVSCMGVAIVGTLIPFILYGMGIGILGSVKASLFVTVEPISSGILTWICFGTKFTFPDIFGFFLILGAIELVSVISFREEKKKR